MVQDLGLAVAFLVLVSDLLGGGEHVLEGYPVLDQQANLDVHHVQVLFHLLVRSDVPHHLRLQLLTLWEEGREERNGGEGREEGRGGEGRGRRGEGRGGEGRGGEMMIGRRRGEGEEKFGER